MLQDVTALICMSLMGFSAWWTIGPRGYLKSCNFFHWLHCTPKLKDTALSIAVYIQDRLEMKLGPSKPLFHSYLIAKGTKKRDAPSAARKGGRMSSCNTKSGIRTGTKQDKKQGPPLKSRECHAAVDNFARTSEA